MLCSTPPPRDTSAAGCGLARHWRCLPCCCWREQCESSRMTQWTEAERFLLDGVRQRDADAWAQLVARYEGRLLAFARGRGISAADAEDLVQDAFLHLLRGLDNFRGEA